MDASLEKELEQALGEKCAAVETSVPEYLRSAEMGRKIRQEHYWPGFATSSIEPGMHRRCRLQQRQQCHPRRLRGATEARIKQDGMTVKKIVIVMLRVGLFRDC